mmetsp:Transcript_121723/g.303710  ORF Transcript_121723/g.303710 Transcript_121723/m.303710 type:complete len:297 (-) Transcript_121723:1187-2077(-)
MARRPNPVASRDCQRHWDGAQRLDPTAKVLPKKLVCGDALRERQGQTGAALQQPGHPGCAILVDPCANAEDMALDHISLFHELGYGIVARSAIVTAIRVEIHICRAITAPVLVFHCLDVVTLCLVGTRDERRGAASAHRPELRQCLAPRAEERRLARGLQRRRGRGIRVGERIAEVRDCCQVQLRNAGLDPELVFDAVIENHEELAPDIVVQQDTGLAQLGDGLESGEQAAFLVLVETLPHCLTPEARLPVRRHASGARGIGHCDVRVNANRVRASRGRLSVNSAPDEVALQATRR